MTNELSLDDSDFVIFGVPELFKQDLDALAHRWRELQALTHPDRFANQGAAAQRVAMQWSVRVNEAYARLKDPVARASLLCELGGAPIQAETNTAMPTQFLMQQMMWREALEDAPDGAAAQALADEVLAERERIIAGLGQLLDERHDYPLAAEQVRALMFIERFLKQLDIRLDQLAA